MKVAIEYPNNLVDLGVGNEINYVSYSVENSTYYKIEKLLYHLEQLDRRGDYESAVFPRKFFIEHPISKLPSESFISRLENIESCTLVIVPDSRIGVSFNINTFITRVEILKEKLKSRMSNPPSIGIVVNNLLISKVNYNFDDLVPTFKHLKIDDIVLDRTLDGYSERLEEVRLDILRRYKEFYGITFMYKELWRGLQEIEDIYEKISIPSGSLRNVIMVSILPVHTSWYGKRIDEWKGLKLPLNMLSANTPSKTRKRWIVDNINEFTRRVNKL